MDRKIISISFFVLSLLCSINLCVFAAVKPDRQDANMQIMPSETYTAMQRLVDQGIVKLPAGCRNVRNANFDRQEMAVLTLQAMKRIGMDENGLVDGKKKEDLAGYKDTLYLKDALTLDLKNMGMSQEYLMNDITSNYDALSKELRSFFEENKASNEEVLNTSKKSADEIRAKYEKSKKELDEVKAYREQLEFALNSVKVNTDQRVEELCKALENMTQKA